MRISDWSSDVCSSDLIVKLVHAIAGDSAVGRDGMLMIAASRNGERIALDDLAGERFVHFEMAERFRSAGRVEKRIDFHALAETVVLAAGECEHATDEPARRFDARSEEHTSELQSLMRISYDVFCL